ncbi:hypothetical protein [Georgenia ruanii]|uniref:hypothetical protein n=1 Tax=Georgenia ruanii TaxID=348442 RepID=UPI00126500D2|nr:hypothetical protein [Georgenia ruanii]
MKVDLLCVDGCPSWQVAHERLTEVLARLGRDVVPQLVEVTTSEQAVALGFAGSPPLISSRPRSEPQPTSGDRPQPEDA